MQFFSGLPIAFCMLLFCTSCRRDERPSLQTKVSHPVALTPNQANSNARVAKISWVKIPGGAFAMGSNESVVGTETPDSTNRPKHHVQIRTFRIAKTLVTFQQYIKCVTGGFCTPPHTSDGSCVTSDGKNLSSAFLGDDQPVVCVDWEQANSFCAWVGGRLPTEAEWEYAARGAGKGLDYPWGDEDATCSRAVLGDVRLGAGCGNPWTQPVCSKPAGNTKQGLCDMAGNVWQMTQDWFHDSYAGAPSDGSAWLSAAGYPRVLRGGSWAWVPWPGWNSNTYRFYFWNPKNRSEGAKSMRSAQVGFRPVKDI